MTQNLPDSSQPAQDQDQPFLDAILADPENMTPRLVYADWLEEQLGKDPLAEFIRIQCELTDLPWYDDAYPKLVKRELQLIKRYKEHWLGEIADATTSAKLYRGFCEEVIFGRRQWEKHGRRVFELAPIRMLRFPRLAEKWIHEIGEADFLHRLKHLSFNTDGEIAAAAWDSLLSAGNLSSVTHLSPAAHDSHTFAHALAKSPLADQIQTLDLHQYVMPVNPLTVCHLNSLHTLDVWTANFDPNCLTNPNRLPKLRNVKITSNYYGGAAETNFLETMANSFLAQQLESIELQHIGLGGDLHTLSFPHLKKLHAPGGHAYTLNLIFRGQGYPQLEELSLNGTEIRSEFRKTFLSGHCPNLKELTCKTENAVDPTALEAILRTVKLRSLVLDQSKLGDKVASTIASCENLTGIKKLGLAATGITEQGAQMLLESPYLDGLHVLKLERNAISADLQKAFRKRFGTGVCTFSRAN